MRAARGVRIELHKRIPAAAGLGGGSSDAAAVLYALDRLLALDLSTFDLAALGADLGSDVPFCVHGGAATMRGRGDVIERVTRPEFHVVVAVPPFALATPRVYRAWDALGRAELDARRLGSGDRRPRQRPRARGGARRAPAARVSARRSRRRPVRRRSSPAADPRARSIFDDADAAAAAAVRVDDAGIAWLCVAGSTATSGIEPVGP